MAEDEKGKCFLLLYGSQTGQAQAIAELLFEESSKRGYSPKLSCLSGLDNVRGRRLQYFSVLHFICFTI